MLNKISNIAGREEIEKAFDLKFEFGSIYRSQIAINGFKESSVVIITSKRPKIIQFGIWGILPQGYTDAWKHFQANLNTLTTPITSLKNTEWLLNAAQERRCLIIATGYFTSMVKNNGLFPYFNTPKNREIFCFAGIYNVLEDGFITCSILCHPNQERDDIIEASQPIIISHINYSEYLDDRFTFENLQNGSYEIAGSEFSSYQISKQFYKIKSYGPEILQPQINDDFYS